ncbi:MAG TPA: macrolide 2'-phosphotransferase [Opitutaceae bacterium]|nr:macrolide 2'-phosphotransferase [Opitutaceae bacterium]HRJ47925.1 macrolide 2'-phosphotransferase [Opitutaceae bacterium]
MDRKDILELAARHGLHLGDDISLNEMGIDYKVAFGTDTDGQKWVLRIPRRAGLTRKIEQERKILSLARQHLSVAVPDWKITSPELIAYPLLANLPVLTFDPETHGIIWHLEQNNSRFVSSLARVLVELHAIPAKKAVAIGLKSSSPQMFRQQMLHDIATVKREIGISAELEGRWLKWVDTDRLWPGFSSFIHGDLYAGHVLASNSGEVSGIIDWSEAQVGDPSVDFAGHMAVYGEQGLRDLIRCYEKSGGRIWETVVEHTVERHSASPLKYAVFAIQAKLDVHIQAAKSQLGIL